MEQITVGNIRIEIVRKDIRNIHLGVYPPAGRVRIAAPLKVKADAIRLFAIAKMAWIKRHQRKFETQERMTPRAYKQRESHYFRGRRYLLHIIEADQPPGVVVKNRKILELRVRPGASTAKRHEVLTAWYRAQLKTWVPPLIEKWEKILRLKVAHWQVKQMKTKWGSCNIEKKRIWLNLELAKKPLHCLEYIIVHEMVHLLERRHNEHFLYHMDKHLPTWRQLKAELNTLPVSHAEWR